MSDSRAGESVVDRVAARTVELLASSGQFSEAEAVGVCEILLKEGVTGERLAEAVEGLEDADANP
jgi:hypothetical protein